MTVNTHLTNTASILVLSSDENSSVSTSIGTLSSRLESYFTIIITSHFQFGSNTRGTILPRKADGNSDVDYMVVFNTGDGERTCTALKDYFYVFWETVSYEWNAPQWIKDKVDRAKRISADAKSYEAQGMPATAEVEIKKIVPSL